MVYLSECLIINLDELASLNKGKESAMKEVITKGAIKVRKAYRRDPESLVRRASFTGSVNDPQILTDTTGSRRFLIHEVERIDYRAKIDMDAVWAEVYTLYKAGEKYWFEGKEIQQIDSHNNRFRQATALEEMLLIHYQPADGQMTQGPIHRWTATQLMNHMLEHKRLPRAASSSYLGRLLNRHGFTSVNLSGVYLYDIQERTKPVKAGRKLFGN